MEFASEDMKLILVGAKFDLYEAEGGVTRADAEATARKLGVPYFETSAKSGLNIDALFLKLTQLALSEESKAEPSGTTSVVVTDGKNESGEKKKKGCC